MEKQGEEYWSCWAKSDGARWHSLPCHLLDVAAVASVLLERTSEITSKEWYEPKFRNLLIFLASAHDIGKANPFFQAKDSYQTIRLRGLGLAVRENEPVRHGQATGAFLKPWLEKSLGWPHCESELVALAVGGHHGTFFSVDGTSQSRLGVNRNPWDVIGNSLLDELAELLGVIQVDCPQPTNPFLAWLAGFVTVADWLGSHKQMVTWQSQFIDLGQYYIQAQTRAIRLLDSLNWIQPNRTVPLSLEELLPEGAAPNELQLTAQQLSGEFTLAIVEAPTGHGKTEAAFALAESARSNGAGIFFALPTMATANGLFMRVSNYLVKANRDSHTTTRILHSRSWLYRDKVNIEDSEGDQSCQAEDWFDGSKRGLMAPYGVGTIDQVLMGALKAKHGFVRLFALAGKVVVIDEVHAYDIYMSDLMDVLLGWLKALGCSVVLMSATLPVKRRNELLKAWGVEVPEQYSRYPSITWVDNQGGAKTKVIRSQMKKPLTFSVLPVGDKPLWQAGADEILIRVRENAGLGTLVVNTVSDAQAAYLYLSEQELDGIQLDIFHARFTLQDRDRIEQHVLSEYGKIGARKEPRILVATQVVEQSLDLDFDHMVTALAPIDLLIQRAGRLHRHERFADGRLRIDQGSDERQDPVICVVSQEFDSSVETFISDFVYAKSILLLTLAYLMQHPQFSSTEDVASAIESVYSESSSVITNGAAMKQLVTLKETELRKATEAVRKAERATISPVEDVDFFIVEQDLRLDEYDHRHGSDFGARTRLVDRPSVTVALLKSEEHTIHDLATDDSRNVFFSSLNCTPPIELWKELIELGPLQKWRQSGALSRTTAIVIPFAGRTYDIDYSPDLGLTWKKKNA